MHLGSSLLHYLHLRLTYSYLILVLFHSSEEAQAEEDIRPDIGLHPDQSDDSDPAGLGNPGHQNLERCPVIFRILRICHGDGRLEALLQGEPRTAPDHPQRLGTAPPSPYPRQIRRPADGLRGVRPSRAAVMKIVVSDYLFGYLFSINCYKIAVDSISVCSCENGGMSEI